jgi:coenzyme PQQ precursor peptide PqqA
MAWKAPKIVEVPVGMEINMYVRDPQVSGQRSITTNAGGPPGATRSRSWGRVITPESTSLRL